MLGQKETEEKNEKQSSRRVKTLCGGPALDRDTHSRAVIFRPRPLPGKMSDAGRRLRLIVVPAARSIEIKCDFVILWIIGTIF